MEKAGSARRRVEISAMPSAPDPGKVRSNRSDQFHTETQRRRQHSIAKVESLPEQIV
jgi:hypothetical protein